MEVWMPRFGIAEGHELHLFQGAKAKRELKRFERHILFLHFL
jgi:hypothetical protein